MELKTARCTVRSYRPDDAPSLAAHGNNRKVWLHLRDRFPHPFRDSDGAAYIASVLSRPVQENFAIAVDDHAIGGISLRVGTDIERLSAELGYWIGEAFWGRGDRIGCRRRGDGLRIQGAASRADLCRSLRRQRRVTPGAGEGRLSTRRRAAGQCHQGWPHPRPVSLRAHQSEGRCAGRMTFRGRANGDAPRQPVARHSA